MDRFARGTDVELPAFGKPPRVVTTAARPTAAPPAAPAPPAPRAPSPTATAASPARSCDLASTCPQCGTMMEPEHAHYRCARCGYRDSCCF